MVLVLLPGVRVGVVLVGAAALVMLPLVETCTVGGDGAASAAARLS